MSDRPVVTRRQFVVGSALGVAGLAAGAALPAVAGAVGEAQFAYVGTYTSNPPGGGGTLTAAGIYVFRVAAGSGALTPIQTVPSANPSFVALDPTQRFLYAVNEIDNYQGQQAGSVEAYAIDPATGMLTLLNRQSSVGTIPAHLAVDPTGRYVVLANYVGGDFVVLPIGADGRLGPATDDVKDSGKGPNTARQEAPHPHCVTFDPAGRYIATADLGNDKVQVFRLDTATGKLARVSEATMAAGAGPRHLAFHPNARILYVISELNATITALAYDAASGKLGAEIQSISTVPATFTGTKSTAEIAVHPSGKFVYGSNRRQPDATAPEADAIVGFTVDQASGKLTLIGHATQNIKYPRNFALDPTATWLYACNQRGDSIVQFRIDPATGQLSPTGQVTQTPTPVSLVFRTAAAVAPGLPGTGAGGGARRDGTLGALAAAGLGAAALAALARRKTALAAQDVALSEDDPR